MSRLRDPALWRVLLTLLRLPGGAAFALPRAGASTFGLEDGPRSRYLVRLFAARNLTLAAGLLLAEPRARAEWYRAAVLCDVLDVAAGVWSEAEGKPSAAARRDTAISATATILALAGLWRDRG